MYRRGISSFVWMAGCFLLLCSCKKEDGVTSMANIPRPIEWDESSKMRVSPPNIYGGYARVKQLQDNSLFMVYSDSRGIVGQRSFDLGATWTDNFLIIPNNPQNFVTNAEVNQLANGDIMVWANYRVPTDNTDTTRKLQIGFVKSSDHGATWSAEKIVFRAGHRWEEGCWEPVAIQLPSGEVQVYFANEFPYKGADQSQEISILSSFDNGETWTTEPKQICYRRNFRDGMPVPSILKSKQEIVMAIEDNGYDLFFKPSIIRTSLSNPWSEPVLANSLQREFAFLKIFPQKIGPGSGAPYIAQHPDGPTILMCQSRYKRNNTGTLDNSVPLVAVGDEQARNFDFFSQPFSDIPNRKHGFWNSVTVLDNGDIIVLTTTDGYSENGAEEVWMIRGRLKNR
jgi:hypothetical protein